MESRGGPGVFIVVEGPEGAGKSTLARWLGARLVAEGLRVVPVREPGGTPVAVTQSANGVTLTLSAGSDTPDRIVALTK